MAIKRRLGSLADLLLRYHLQNRNQEDQSNRVGQRQIELANLNDRNEILKSILTDPTGQRARMAGPGWERFIPSADQVLADTGKEISDFSELTKAPTEADIEARYHSRPGALPHGEDRPAIEQLLAQTAARKASIESGLKATKVAEAVPGPVPSVGPTGTMQTEYLTPFQAAAKGPLQTERTPEQEGSRLGQIDISKLNLPGHTEAEISHANAMEKGLRKEKVLTAGQIASAEASAREAAEWLDPKVVAAKLDFEKQKRIGELAMVGDRVQAEDVAKRNAAIKGLMPTYNEYRKLAVNVVNSWAGAGTAGTAALKGAVGHIPVIGQFLESGLEAAHAASAGALDENMGKMIAELNRLKQTLAQGMANAVLGNRGQTTENDRRTAENILISSFTDAKSAKDLLDITDRMFTIMPTVAGQVLHQDPFATPAQILEEVKKQVDQERQGSPNAVPTGVQDILNRPPRR